VDFVRRHIAPEVLWSDIYQDLAWHVLENTGTYLRTYFAVGEEGKLVLTVFLPVDDSFDLGLDPGPHIAKVASSRPVGGGRIVRTGAEAREHARSMSLAVRAAGGQGVAGHAFVRQCAVEVLDNGQGINWEFSRAMEVEWDRESDSTPRDWRSILALPVLDTPSWVPIAVIVLTSNRPDPIWRRLEPQQDLAELKAMLRRTARSLVVDLPGRISGGAATP